MNDLEHTLGSPEATPSVITARIAELPSATVSAPRTLSGALVRKLEEVAEHHGGKVPIHGRLFFQWMHFAYPLECPYPFPSDSVRPMSDTEFLHQTGLKAFYTQEEWGRNETPAYTAVPVASRNCDEDADECMAMWTPVEELVEHRQVQHPVGDDAEIERAKAWASSPLASFLRFAALLATLPALVQAARQSVAASRVAQQLLGWRPSGDKKGHLP